MRIVVVAAALLAMAGCKSTAERAAEDDGYCQSLGAPVGSPPYVQCRLVQQQRRDQKQAELARDIQETGRSIGDGLARSQAINAANRPVNCTSTRIGNQVNTNCY